MKAKFSKILEFNINDVYKMIETGEINDAKTLCAILRGLKL